MKHSEIQISKIYWCKISGKFRCVRIIGPAPGQKWYVVNLFTGRRNIAVYSKQLDRECVQPTEGLPFGWTDEVIVTLTDGEKIQCKHPGGECSLEQFDKEGTTLGEWLRTERPGMRILSFRPVEPVK